MPNKIRFLKIAVLTAILALFSCTPPDNVKHYPPVKPQGLYALVSNPNEITLSWEKDTSSQDAANYYRIYKSTQPFSGYSVEAKKVYGNETAIMGLLASTKYYFKLTAINDYGESDTTDAVWEKTLIGTPENLKTTLLPNNDLMLEWDKVIDNEKVLRSNGGGNADGVDDIKYKVYLSDVVGYYVEYSFVGETNETRMKFANIDDNKTYYFKVSAVDSQEREGAKSDSVSISVSGVLPLAPQGLFAVLKVDSFDNGKIGVQLSWDDVSGADGYRVYYSTQPQLSYQYYAPTLNNFIVVNGLKAGETYFFKVSAVNKSGEGEKSQEAFIQIPAPTASSTPTGLSAGSAWYFKVSASNAYGESPLSS